MKNPSKMTHTALVDYTADLKRMIQGLQVQLTKALEEIARLRTNNPG